MRSLRLRLAPLLRRRPSPVPLLWGAGLGLIMLFMWQQSSVDRLVMQLERAESERRELESEVSALGIEVDQLSSLAQVERRAARELGLIRPETDQIVRLRFEDAPSAPSRFRLDPLVPEATAGPRPEDSPR